MTFDLISGLHMQIQTWHPPLWLCTHAKYYVKSGLTNVLKNANKMKNMHLFSIRIANYNNNSLKNNARSLLLHIVTGIYENRNFILSLFHSQQKIGRFHQYSCSSAKPYEPQHEISNILTSVDSDKPLQPPFKLRNS